MCFNPMPIYANPPFRGIKIAKSPGDGYGINIEWYKAIPDRLDYTVAYNIYYSTNADDVFTEGVKFVVTNPNLLTAKIVDLTPGDVYYFAVRGTEFPITHVNLSGLPIMYGLGLYPEGALLADIDAEQTTIPVMDADTFPTYGILQIGGELIYYGSIDYPNSTLINAVRGQLGTEATEHTVDGYDGYVYRNPLVMHFKGFEDQNISTMLEENNFDWPYNAHTVADGYKDKTSIVYPNLDPADCIAEAIPSYDFSGYRANPIDRLSGKNVGSYYGGERYCADGYGKVGGRIRGVSVTDQATAREEVLLETTGQPMVLVRRQTGGKVSAHYQNHRENTTYRGLDNYGTDLILGYEQFFNSKRSDGRIMVRFGPTNEDIKRDEHGLENVFIPNCWTTVYPQLKDGDFLIRFYQDGSEEFRYIIKDVERNITLLGATGVQKFTAVRVRKTDPIYQFLTFRDTSFFPETLSTTVGFVPGADGIPPHVHTFVVNEGVFSISQINQTTGIAQGHNHEIRNGEIVDRLGHGHIIILP